jgi:asparagine synthase (glutamine-hydrolysing)
MSAIWGCIEYKKKQCTVDTMSNEYRRKCKLHSIKEVTFGNALIGNGLQIINEEDEHEEMPYIIDDEDAIITADCVLDNRDELIRELLPDADKSDDNSCIPSGKLLALAYKKWHYDIASYIRGIFSIAVYDRQNGRLFICTDRTSSRCLYYYRDSSKCLFSTLISPIKELVPELKRNDLYLKDFALIPGLMPGISSSETPWENVFILEAGCYAVISENEIEIKRYYEPACRKLSGDIDKLKEEFLDVYGKAVERAIRTNKGVGIALSGGFDSASVAALAAPELEKQGKKLFSYTYVPRYDVSRFYDRRHIINETGYVKELVKMYPSIAPEFLDNDGKSFWGYIDELLDVMEIPFKAFVNLPLLMEIYRKAGEQGCGVFLNGQTGNASVSFGKIDEAVYDLYRNGRFAEAFRYLNNYLKLAGLSRKKWMPKEIKKIRSQKGITGKEVELSADEINPFVNPDLLKGYRFSQRNRSGLSLNNRKAILKREQYRNKLFFLPALSYIGAMETKLGLYTGVVIRDATRDPDVLDFCISFPFEYFCYNGTPRYLIRGFMHDRLPHHILYPVLKVGVQSADWIYRFKSDSDDIYHCISEMTDKSDVEDYLNKKKLKEFAGEKAPLIHKNESRYLNFFISYILHRYIS